MAAPCCAVTSLASACRQHNSYLARESRGHQHHGVACSKAVMMMTPSDPIYVSAALEPNTRTSLSGDTCVGIVHHSSAGDYNPVVCGFTDNCGMQMLCLSGKIHCRLPVSMRASVHMSPRPPPPKGYVYNYSTCERACADETPYSVMQSLP